LAKVTAVIPVYNEGKTLAGILSRVAARVDYLVCVNDGSTDNSLQVLQNFARKRKGTFIVDLPHNTGMAGAIKNGFLFVLYLMRQKWMGPEDVVVTIDADGQHKPEYIRSILPYMAQKKADVVLTRRDFSVYPLYKVLGNRFLTFTNSVLSGMRYRDVESGLRFLKAKTLEPILEYYTGIQYSCAQEIALITARSGFKVDNHYLVKIAYYRAGTTFWDGFIVLFLSFLAFGRMVLGVKKKVAWDGPLARRSLVESKKLWNSKKRKN
jgi:glycosyltransferase involved in cell wall biosynthesis